MKLAWNRSVLGLALGETSASAAEVTLSGGKATVQRTVEIPYPEGITLEKPEALGAELKRALGAKGLRSTQAIVGLSARRLLARSIVLPTADQLKNGELDSELERELALDPKELAFDWTDGVDPGTGRVFCIAAMRSLVDLLQRVATAAGLTLQGITSSSLALLAEAAPTSAGLHILAVPEAAELAYWDGRGPRMLRSIRAADPSGLPLLAPEARRAAFELGSMALNGDALGCVVWPSRATSADEMQEFSSALGLGAEPGVWKNGTTWGVGLKGAEPRFAVAAALGVAGVRGVLPVDLLHPKVGRKAAPTQSRRNVLILAASVVIVGGALAAWLDLRGRESDVSELAEQMTRLEPDAKEAEKFAERVRYGLEWFDSRPSFLEGLRQATLAFPEEGSVWATAYTARDGGVTVVGGKAADSKSVIGVLDRLKANAAFAEVKLLDMRDAGGRSNDVAFSLSFRFLGGR